jgi:hypothetical protein
MKSPFYVNVHGKITEKDKGWAPPKIFGYRVVIPEFEIFSNPTIRISEIKRRRFNLIDRAIRNLKFRITSEGKLVDKGTL